MSRFQRKGLSRSIARLLAVVAIGVGSTGIQAASTGGERATSVCSFRDCGTSCVCRFQTWYEARPIRYGYGMSGDREAAAYWYAKHAERGDRRARLNLGLILRDGAGMGAQSDKALDLLQDAADDGLMRAHLALGNSYRLGHFGAIGTDKALRHYRIAAMAGLAKAQHSYANMLADGLATPVDLVKAYKWYWLAGFKGLDKAERALNRLRPEMSPEQRQEGRSRAAAWRETH